MPAGGLLCTISVLRGGVLRLDLRLCFLLLAQLREEQKLHTLVQQIRQRRVHNALDEVKGHDGEHDERRHAGDALIDGRAHAAQGRAVGQLRLVLGAEVCDHVRVDAAGGDAVDADAAGSKLHRE